MRLAAQLERHLPNFINVGENRCRNDFVGGNLSMCGLKNGEKKKNTAANNALARPRPTPKDSNKLLQHVARNLLPPFPNAAAQFQIFL